MDYQGTVLLVSHDRAFLNDVATSTLAIEPDGRVKEYDGGYDDYLRQRREESAVEKPPAAPARAAPAPRHREPTGRPPAEARTTRSGRSSRPCPARIESLELARAELHDAMADPSFYRQDGGAIAEAKARLESIESELAAAYARWEELEAMAG